MNGKQANDVTQWVIRRILVALDASAHSLAALEEAAHLAAAMEAELLGLFVEDINLLRLAGLPFTRQISYPSGTAERLSAERLDRELKARAEMARKALAEAAERRRAAWSFRIARGQVAAEILAAAAEADLILAGRAGWSPARLIGSTARALLSAAPRAVLLMSREAAGKGPVMAVYDGSADARRALDTAARLARAEEVGMVVFLAAATSEQQERWRQQAALQLQQLEAAATFRRLLDGDVHRFAQAVRAEGGGVLVLAASSPLAETGALQTLLQEVPNPVLILRS